MRRVALAPGADVAGFRHAARALVAEGVAPQAVAIEAGEGGAPGLFEAPPLPDAPPLSLPRTVADLVASVGMHRDPARWDLLYALVFRVASGERLLVQNAADPLVHRLQLMRKNVGRDIHKMHAFVRFRQAHDEAGERFLAWFEPEHFILEAVGPFFRDRFGAMRFSIRTPIGSIDWDRARLTYGPPGRRENVPAQDAFEDGWRTYYGATFNPARLNTQAMRAEMPKKYWRNLPEAQLIPSLVRKASSRVEDMLTREPTMPHKREPKAALARLETRLSEGETRERPASRAALEALVRAYTPPEGFSPVMVPGEGPDDPPIAFVGEQPGDQEDLAGRPFVGPAGQLLDRAMQEAGIERAEVYLTNAVKHFKYAPRGKRRIHQKPNAGEVAHYRWWLKEELALVRPRLVVALGATALLALSGRAGPLHAARGPTRFEGADGASLPGHVTVHPSYLLRLPDPDAKARAWRDFVADLAQANEAARGLEA